jgi:hypothetical protein
MRQGSVELLKNPSIRAMLLQQTMQRLRRKQIIAKHSRQEQYLLSSRRRVPER